MVEAGLSDKDDSGPAGYAWSDDSSGSDGEASGGEALAAAAIAARSGGGSLDFTFRALQRAEDSSTSSRVKPAGECPSSVAHTHRGCITSCAHPGVHMRWEPACSD